MTCLNCSFGSHDASGLQFSAQVVHDYVSSSYSGGTTLVCMLIMLLTRATTVHRRCYPQQQSSDSVSNYSARIEIRRDKRDNKIFNSENNMTQ